MIFLTFLLACAAAALSGVLFQPGDWYRGLKRPSFTPPDWAFPVVWTTLYVLIARAGARLAVVPGAGTAFEELGHGLVWLAGMPAAEHLDQFLCSIAAITAER